MSTVSAVIIGAGPYGLSVAAHLNAAGLDVVVFGEPMAFWERNMPQGMFLRSPRVASELSSPTGALTLDEYQRSIGKRISSPVPRELFVSYGRWFQAKAVPNIDKRKVTNVRKENGAFCVELGDGEQITTERVIIAAGIAPFAFRPAEYANLPQELASHSSDHQDLSHFRGQKVAVVGAGQSALESAALLHEAGADVELLVRHPIRWSWQHPWMHTVKPVARLLYAWPDVGPALISHAIARPDVFCSLPLRVQNSWRLKALTPNGTRWLEPRLHDVAATCCHVTSVGIRGEKAILQLSNGTSRTVDNVLLATGYRIDVTKYDFLDLQLIEQLRIVDGSPELGPALESSVPGLHFVGAPAVRNYGPLMRFVAGAGYAAKSVTRGIQNARRLTSNFRTVGRSSGARSNVNVASNGGDRGAAKTLVGRTLLDFYRCPEEIASLSVRPATTPPGYFRFGEGTICYGSSAKAEAPVHLKNDLKDCLPEVKFAGENVILPFNPNDVIDALRFERYCKTDKTPAQELVWSAYYFIRPVLGVHVRRHLQKARVRNWRSIEFPAWPVDCTVERLHERLLQLCIEANGATQVPFIWFWPNGHSSCVAMTHDVETAMGREFCRGLIDLDERYGIKASFQLIPEDRYTISQGFLDSIRSRGCEINIHDLNHDGRLFANAVHFPEKARRINQYATTFDARGFRSGALHHNLSWYNALKVSYDMSVPNTARLDPQCGGCCTVLPYFIGDILEIPLTTIQDYSLFNLLDQYSIDLWQHQLDIIRASHGIATFNIHPDYIVAHRARAVYEQLLQHLAETRARQNVWHALPGEVDRWWRDRANMRIVQRDGTYKIEGPGSERAALAYARMEDGELKYFIESQTPPFVEQMRFTA